MSMTPQAPALAGDATRVAVGQAARNALQLASSLLGTWGIALLVRLGLPRVLGPEQFGVVNFADALTATVFVALTFGVDTYIRKDVTLRPSHADEFFGTLLLARLGLTVVLLAALDAVMVWTAQPAAIRETVFLFGAGQFFFVTNNSFAALLHARARVAGLSVVNVASKLLWAAGIGAALWGGAGTVAIAAAFLASEALRAAALWVLSRRHLGLRWTLQPRAAWTVAVASLPFFIAVISQTVGSRIGSALIGFLAAPREVGLYGAVWTLAGMTLLLAPLLNWVLMPLLSQAAAESKESLLRGSRRALELVLSVSVPVALALAVGADVWVGLLFGGDYAQAVPALRLMAPVFVVTYVAMISSTTLILQQRAWAVTSVSIGSLVLNPVLLVLLVPAGERWFGPGGPAIGAALALLVAELVAMGRLQWALRGGTLDRSSVLQLAKLAAICVLVMVVDRALVTAGPWRLALDAAVYTIAVLVTGAFPRATLVAVARAVRSRRAGGSRVGGSGS